jgi:hypothetical protein
VLLDKQHFAESHFELVWPKELFIEELDRSLNDMNGRPLGRTDGGTADWKRDCAILLEEAFRYEEPKREFSQCVVPNVYFQSEGTSQLDWLKALRAHAESLPVPQGRRPYWSSRRSGPPQQPDKRDLATTAQRIRDLVREFEDNGYLAQAFGQTCVDSGDTVGTLGPEPVQELHRHLGRDNLWPIAPYGQKYDIDDLCDITEFIFDHVSRPMSRERHRYQSCGMHYADFRRGIAQKLYRWRVNVILSESIFDLTLNKHGRFEEVASDDLEPLVVGVHSDTDSGGSQHNELTHAVDQFRRRNASETEKRQAIVTLAGILEERRDLLKVELFKKDEGSLFDIANNFNLRHRDGKQKPNYDADLYFQWIFYWYVSTIRLTDKILERQAKDQG